MDYEPIDLNSSDISLKIGDGDAATSDCEATYNTLLNPADARSCSRLARQRCSNCDAKLCDIHAEFCAICLAFFCDGCLDLHNEEGEHADGSLGQIVGALLGEGVQG
jgi:hypothetical protein